MFLNRQDRTVETLEASGLPTCACRAGRSCRGAPATLLNGTAAWSDGDAGQDKTLLSGYVVCAIAASADSSPVVAIGASTILRRIGNHVRQRVRGLGLATADPARRYGTGGGCKVDRVQRWFSFCYFAALVLHIHGAIGGPCGPRAEVSATSITNIWYPI